MTYFLRLKVISAIFIGASLIAALPSKSANAQSPSPQVRSNGKVGGVFYVNQSQSAWPCEILFYSDNRNAVSFTKKWRPVTSMKICDVARVAHHLGRTVGMYHSYGEMSSGGWGDFFNGIRIDDDN